MDFAEPWLWLGGGIILVLAALLACILPDEERLPDYPGFE